jgi:hypothetical protein
MLEPLVLNVIFFILLGLNIISFAESQKLFWFMDTKEGFINILLLAVIMIKLILTYLPYTPYIIYGTLGPLLIITLLILGIIKAKKEELNHEK